MVTTNATAMVRGGVADVMKDLKNRPISTRIRSIVKGSILDTSSSALVSVSYEIAGVPVRYTSPVNPVSPLTSLMKPRSSGVMSGMLPVKEESILM